jgi:hypothetical protein
VEINFKWEWGNILEQWKCSITLWRWFHITDNLVKYIVYIKYMILWYIHYTSIKLLKIIKWEGEWWRGWIQLWYVTRTSVNVTMYSQYKNKNKIKTKGKKIKIMKTIFNTCVLTMDFTVTLRCLHHFKQRSKHLRIFFFFFPFSFIIHMCIQDSGHFSSLPPPPPLPHTLPPSSPPHPLNTQQKLFYPYF